MREKLILTVPYWNLENQPERQYNLGCAVQSLKAYAKYHNSNSNFFEIEILPVNLGENINSDYPNDLHIPHTDLEYRFEKPTRLNSLFIKLHNDGVKWIGMCDPDLILFYNGYHDLFNSIEQQLNYSTMLTYSFVRTKPELREYLSLCDYDTYHLLNNHLITEAKKYAENWEVCGGVFFISLDSFIDLGGFNEDYRVYGFDDVDFTQRFRLKGGNVVSTPSVYFYHLYHPQVIKTATPEELERFEYELKYWRIHREIFKVEIEKPIEERKKLNHRTPRLRGYKQYVDMLNGEIPFSLELGKHPITSFPLAFQRQMGLVEDDVFYSIE